MAATVVHVALVEAFFFFFNHDCISLHHESNARQVSGMPSFIKTKTTISLAAKLDVFRHFDAGEHAIDIGVTCCLTPTTMRTINIGRAMKLTRCALKLLG